MREWVEEGSPWPAAEAIQPNGDGEGSELPPVPEVATKTRRAVGAPRVAEIRSANPMLRGRVLLGIRDLVFHQEVLDHFERDARLDVVGAASQPEVMVQRVRDLNPDVTVVCASMLREIRHPSVGRLPNLMVVAEEMTVPVLRDAIEAGARGVFAWPDERDELSDEIAGIHREPGDDPRTRGCVIAVYGARGGSGTTFVATQLAASFADLGRRCVLVDLDASFADVTIALGVDHQVRTIADLVPVVGELGPDHVEDALFRHARGFSVLLAPSEPGKRDVPSGLYTAAIALLAGAYEVVVAHVPRGLDPLIRSAIGMADDVVLVVGPDLFSLYAARRAMQGLGLEGQPGKCRVLVNPMLRSEITPKDVERVLGITPFAAVRFDAAVPRAQGEGRLLPPRARKAGRDLRALAGMLHQPARRGPSDREVS